MHIETKGCKKTKDRREEIHDTHSRTQPIRLQKKWRYFGRTSSRTSRKAISTV